MSGQTAPPKPSEWQKTQFANLVHYVPSGIYFARIKVRGKLFRKSSKTGALTVAKLRLADMEKQSVSPPKPSCFRQYHLKLQTSSQPRRLRPIPFDSHSKQSAFANYLITGSEDSPKNCL